MSAPDREYLKKIAAMATASEPTVVKVLLGLPVRGAVGPRIQKAIKEDELRNQADKSVRKAEEEKGQAPRPFAFGSRSDPSAGTPLGSSHCHVPGAGVLVSSGSAK